jgi:hypothetical protein
VTEEDARFEPLPRPVPRVVLPTASVDEMEHVPDERRTHKAKAKARCVRGGERCCSSRLAKQGTGEYISMADKARKCQDLLDALVGCSPKLHAKALKNQVVDALRQPMGLKTADLRASVAISFAMVPVVAND